MTTIMSVKRKCPNCQAKFEANVPMSTNFRGMTTDLRQVTRGFDPWALMVHSCRACGFSAPTEGFRGKVAKSVSEKIRLHIKPRLPDGDLPAETRWEFAALIAEWRGRDPVAVAEMYRHAAWCAKGGEREVHFRRSAAHWLERALDAGVPDRAPVLYLIGELYRRCGETSIANTWFDLAIKEAEWLKQLAIQQKTNPQEFISR